MELPHSPLVVNQYVDTKECSIYPEQSDRISFWPDISTGGIVRLGKKRKKSGTNSVFMLVGVKENMAIQSRAFGA